MNDPHSADQYSAWSRSPGPASLNTRRVIGQGRGGGASHNCI